MRDIHVPRDKIYIPVLGFGCSSLTSVGRKQALRLLEGAFDAGIRHFDVARYYGYGEAEGILGTFLKSRRSQVTVTTKFGIEPPRPTSTLRVALGIGRRFLRLVPSARKVVHQHTSAFVNVKGNAFSAADAQRNLETSLRELGTDISISICSTTMSRMSLHLRRLLPFFKNALGWAKFALSALGLGSTV